MQHPDGFLHRGDVGLHASLTPEPSFVLDEEPPPRGAAALTESSPVPSQLTQSTRLPRQRPRFHTVQDLDLALNQAIEGKITSKNAWASKEASDLLEGIAHTIESTLEASAGDDYSGFAKVATVVEGCSKVWTSRVDSTYHQSNQMVQRLLRNDGATTSHGDGDEEGTEGTDGSTTERRRGRGASHGRRPLAARTLAIDCTEINLDRRARSALTQTGINPQFRAITEKFDQGSAHGLLMSNTPLGAAGNLILDVDYAREPDREYSAKKMRLLLQERSSLTASPRNSGEGDVSGRVKTEPDADHPDRARGVPPRRPLSAEMEGDAEIHAHLDDLHPFAPRREALEDAGEPGGGGGGLFSSLDVRAPPSRGAEWPVKEEEVAAAAVGAAAPPRWSGAEDDTYEDAYDDMGGGGEEDLEDREDREERPPGEDAATDGSGRDIGRDARRLVSGAAELNAVDSHFAGAAQLALEAEDPAGWCPLGALPSHVLGALRPRSTLAVLHRQHRCPAVEVPPAGAAPKRARRTHAVVFDVPEEVRRLEGSVLTVEAAVVRQGVLRQGGTAGKHCTALGKEIVLGREAAAAALAYTVSATQRSKAEQAGLLLPAPPVAGESIPSYVPHPVTLQSFFQPFSTDAPEWNLLRKTSSGHLLDRPGSMGGERRSALPGTTSTAMMGPSGHTSHEGLGDDGDDVMEDMPADFFPSGAEYEDGLGGEPGGGEEEDTYERYHVAVDNRLLAQFEAQAGSAVSLLTSTRTSGVRSVLTEAAEMAEAIQLSQGSVPAQVDVVRLRQIMWEAVQTHLSGCPAGTAEEAGTAAPPERAGARRKRGRAEETGAAAADREAVALEMSVSDVPPTKTEAGRAWPTLSEVVCSVLPAVPTISSSGTLSPAFFFFSILFLANEHHLGLDNGRELEDLVLRGIVGPAPEAP